MGRLTGWWLNLRVPRRCTVVLLALIAVAGLAVNQQAHADLLITGPLSELPTGLLLYALAALLVAALVLQRVRLPGRTGGG